jgi:hypothetical protein
MARISEVQEQENTRVRVIGTDTTQLQLDENGHVVTGPPGEQGWLTGTTAISVLAAVVKAASGSPTAGNIVANIASAGLAELSKPTIGTVPVDVDKYGNKYGAFVPPEVDTTTRTRFEAPIEPLEGGGLERTTGPTKAQQVIQERLEERARQAETRAADALALQQSFGAQSTKGRFAAFLDDFLQTIFGAF